MKSGLFTNVVKSILYDYHSLSGMTPVEVAISEAEYSQNPTFCSVLVKAGDKLKIVRDTGSATAWHTGYIRKIV